MVLRVQYPNRKFDYVNSLILDRMIREKELRMFFRPSEMRWINIERDSIRGKEEIYYIGPERRM
jgi:hypothetical protein